MQDQHEACADTDLDEEELVAGLREIKLQTYPKGRRIRSMWHAENAPLREVYWEFGRASKRGLGRLTIYDPDGAYSPLSLSLSLSKLPTSLKVRC